MLYYFQYNVMRLKVQPIPYPNMLTAEIVISKGPKNGRHTFKDVLLALRDAFQNKNVKNGVPRLSKVT